MRFWKTICIEQLEPRCMMASDWQNHNLIRDVDRSDLVTPLDVVVEINELNRSGIHQLPLQGPAADELYCDVDGDGWLTPLDVLSIVNAINSLNTQVPQVVGGLSPSSDPNNNGVVIMDNVLITGQSNANARIVLSDNLSQVVLGNTLAQSDGRFSIAIVLAEGAHNIKLTSIDDLGRRSSQSLAVRRGNSIQDWNAAALDIVRQWTTLSNDPYTNRIVTAQPPLVARNLAMIHAAMFDAANAVTNTYPSYKVSIPQQPNASPSAAAAQAAFDVAKTLYSAQDEVAVWQATLNETLSLETDITARDLGIQLGHQVAQAILVLRTNDGAKGSSTYQPVNVVGHWQRTFPDFLPPLLPQWPKVKPFVLTSGDQFRPLPPPTLDSTEYAQAVNQVKEFGGYQSSSRTADQTAIALFWADGGGTATPPGHWNTIAADVMLAQGTGLLQTARTFALLNIAMADAGIASWDAKYYYDYWRPIQAIRQADSDNNADTEKDATWIPLLKTPPFPTYTSGHSTFSGAASTVLAGLFGDNTSFDSTTDGHLAPEQRPLDPSQIVTRHFTSFSQAAEEAGMSRIYGGIHFSFDNTAGLQLGHSIGDAVLASLSPLAP